MKRSEKKHPGKKEAGFLILLYFGGYLLLLQMIAVPLIRRTAHEASELVITALMALIMLCACIFSMPRLYDEWRDFRKRERECMAEAMRTLFILLFIYTAAVIVNSTGLISQTQDEAGHGLSFLFGAVIFAPLMEETVFRGCIYPLMKERFGDFSASAGSSLLFGLLHILSRTQMPVTAAAFHLLIYSAMGFCLLQCRKRTENLIAPSAAHMAYNLLMCAAAMM